MIDWSGISSTENELHDNKIHKAKILHVEIDSFIDEIVKSQIVDKDHDHSIDVRKIEKVNFGEPEF